MSKEVVFRFGDTDVACVESTKHAGFFISEPNDDNIVYIVNLETAETGAGSTFAVEISEDDDYDEIIETTVKMIEYIKQETN